MCELLYFMCCIHPVENEELNKNAHWGGVVGKHVPKLLGV